MSTDTLATETVASAAIADLEAVENEKALLIEAINCAVAWLTQPVQYSDSGNGGAANILRGDCRAAVDVLRAASVRVRS